MFGRFQMWEIAAGAALGSGLAAATDVSAAWLTLFFAVAAIVFSAAQKEWIVAAALFVFTWVAIPVWGAVLPDSWNVPTLARYLPEYQPSGDAPAVDVAEPAGSQPTEP